MVASTVKYDSIRVKSGSAAGVALIRVQPATLTFSIGGTANDASTGTLNLNLRVRAGGNSRKLGIRAAFATIRATASNTKYQPYSYHRIPLINTAIQAAAQAADSTVGVTYNGSSAFTFIDFNTEKVDGK